MALIATRLSKFVSRQSLLQGRCLLSVQQERRRHRSISRRRLPSRTKTFQQRLDEISARDSHRHPAINIGFPLAAHKDTDNSLNKLKKKGRGKQEFAARHRKLKLDLKAVQERWLREQGPHHVRSVTEHYGLYTDLLGPAFFYNTMPLAVCYDYDEAFVTPVCYGNKIFPSEAAMSPFVSYESDLDARWTLVMTSPDGDLQCNDKECLHWMVTNIAGSDVQGGETVCDYLQPFPVRGAGYLRYAFILFKQHGSLDLSDCRRCSASLGERTFSTAEFYGKHKKDLTPASMCFFQSRWDSSVPSVFRDVLKMKEPSYEFVFPPNYPGEEQHSPQPDPAELEWYLDSYFGEDDTLEDWYTEELDTRVSSPTYPIDQSKSPSLPSATEPLPTWMKLRLKDLRLPQHQWKHLKPSS